MNSADIKALKNAPVKPRKNIGSHFITTTKYPFLYQQITKCGCTYVRNLIWYLEHGAMPPEDIAIANPPLPECKAGHLSDRQITEMTHKFVVIRHPVQRFMSLYFDKVAGYQDGEFAGLTRKIAKHANIDLMAERDLDWHRQASLKAFKLFKRQLNRKPWRHVNWHWKPQMVRLGHLRPYGFSVLQLEGLDWQLPDLLQDIVPHIKETMQIIDRRNKSAKPVRTEDVLTEDLTSQILDLYQTDYRIWQEVEAFWAEKRG